MTQPTTWGELMKSAKAGTAPVPNGDYEVKVVEAQATKSSTDKLMFKVKFEIIEGPHVKRRVPNQYTVSTDNPVALAIFFRNMAAMGLDEAFFDGNPNPDQVASALLNRVCRVTLTTEAWQGVDRNKVAATLPSLGSGPMAPGVAVGPATVLPTPGATPALPTPSTSTSADPSPTVGAGPTVGQGPDAPSGPPPLPI